LEGIEWKCCLGLDALFIKIDFFYDQVECLFIMYMLKAIGFGHFFIKTIETIFVEASMSFTINMCGLFKSICLGCPHTPTIYAMETKSSTYLIDNQMAQGLVKGITLSEP
jgi:hypothetical protein